MAQGVTDQILQNRQARQVFDADLAMRKTYDNFNAQLVNMPDEGTWLPAWKEQTQALRDQVLDNPHLSPDSKRILGEKFDGWEEATTSATNIAALLKGHTESRKSALTDATYAAQTGHLDQPGGAYDIMKAAVANHAYSPQEANQITKKFPRMSAQANVDQFIVRHPTSEPDNLTNAKWWKDLTPDDQKAALAGLNAAKLRTWKANFEDMMTDKVDSSTGEIPDNVIKGAIDNRQIDPIVGRNLMQSQKRDTEKADEGQS